MGEVCDSHLVEKNCVAAHHHRQTCRESPTLTVGCKSLPLPVLAATRADFARSAPLKASHLGLSLAEISDGQ